MKKLTMTLVALVVGLGFSATANAGFSTGGYCIPADTQTSATGGISVSDVQLQYSGSSGYTNATNCYGLVSFGGDVDAEIGNINALGWGEWDADNYLKDDSTGSSASGTFFTNWLFTLEADTTSNDSIWTLTITDLNEASEPNLPFTIDLLAFLKAGNDGAFWYFDEAFVDESNPGEFKISWTVGKNDSNNPALSGFSLFLREPVYTSSSGTVITSTGGVPEPGTVGLLGAGLVGGLFGYRRRKQRLG